MGIVLVCIAAFLCLLCAYPWWRYRRARKLLAHLPSLPVLPIIGNLHYFLGDQESFVHQGIAVSKMMDTMKTSFVAWLGPVPFIMPTITEPQELKTITSTFLDKPSQYNFSKICENGLITAPGSVWKHTSKKLAGAYSGKVIWEYQEILNGQAQILVEQLKTEIGKKPFNAYKKYVNWIAFEAICNTTFGVTGSSELRNIQEYHSAFSRAELLWCKRAVMLPCYNDSIYALTADYKEVSKLEKYLNETSQRVLNKRKLERLNAEGMDKNHNDGNEKSKTTYKPYVDILLDLQETDPIFTIRGTETNSSLIETIRLGSISISHL